MPSSSSSASASPPVRRTALITGGNRGIGLAAARALAVSGMRVVLTARHLSAAEHASTGITDTAAEVLPLALDVTDPDGARACARRLEQAGIEVDVLVNNAGVYPTTPVLEVDEATIAAAVAVNLLGPWRTCQAFVPGMVARGYGRVVNVSSGGGQLNQPGGPGPGAYGITKAALNALTLEVAHAVPAGVDVTVNAMDPGWVATRMGGSGAPRTAEQGADTIVWLATLPASGPTGGFFHDRRPVPW
jgi:NAD(P)-dependent dehydrogenase (short-subunit alcohol dehydrogenase family)